MLRIFIIFVFSIFVVSCSTSFVPNYKGLTSNTREPYALDSSFYKENIRHKVITAANYRIKKQYAEAAVELQEIYLFDKEPAIAYSIASNMISLNKIELAKYYIEEALSKDSSFIPAYELLSEAYLAERKLSKAIEIINFVQSIDYKIEREFDLAYAYEFINPNKSIEKYEFLYKKYPESRIEDRLLFLYDKTNQTDKKLNILKTKFLANPSNPEATKVLFSFWISKGDVNEALTFVFQHENQINNDDLVLIYGASSQKILSGGKKCNPNILDTLLSKFDIRFTNDWQIYIQGFYLASEHQRNEYEKQFLAMIERFSDKKQDVFLEIAIFFQKKNRYIDAENLLKHYYTSFSDDFRYPFLLGLNYIYQKKDNHAIGWLFKALDINSNSADIWVNIGIIYDRENKADSAEFAYKNALGIDINHALANNNYAYSLATLGKDLRKALEMSQIAIQKEPSNSAYLDTYGWVLFKLKQYDTAIENILKSIKVGGAGPEVYEHLGDIYKDIGKIDDAKRAYEVGVKLYPTNAELLKKLKKVS